MASLASAFLFLPLHSSGDPPLPDSDSAPLAPCPLLGDGPAFCRPSRVALTPCGRHKLRDGEKGICDSESVEVWRWVWTLFIAAELYCPYPVVLLM